MQGNRGNVDTWELWELAVEDLIIVPQVSILYIQAYYNFSLTDELFAYNLPGWYQKYNLLGLSINYLFSFVKIKNT